MRMCLPLGCLLLSVVAAATATGEVRGVRWAGNRVEPNRVAWFEAPNAPRMTPAARVVLDQRNLAFLPTCSRVRVGTVVEFPNRDREFHDVFSFRDGRVFDPGLSRIFIRR